MMYYFRHPHSLSHHQSVSGPSVEAEEEEALAIVPSPWIKVLLVTFLPNEILCIF
jgi:hypothetical protein